MSILYKYVVFVLLAMSLSGCGSSPIAPSNPAYNQTVTGSVDVFGTNRHALSIPRSGNMTLTLTWQDSVVDLDLYLSNSSCTSLYPMASCGILQSSSSSISTIERVSRTVSSGETYNVFVDNLSRTRTQSYSLAISIQ